MREDEDAGRQQRYDGKEMNWKQIVAGVCGFSFGFWLCMPRNTPFLPRYEVLVSDVSGKGVAFAPVEQLRQDFALADKETRLLARADSYGRASFLGYGARTSPLRQLIVCGLRMKALGVHAPCGYRHHITAPVPGYSEAWRSESTLPLKGRGQLLQIIL